MDQLGFIRQVTLKLVSELSEQQLDCIPEGFNNNIRWNLGHIYLAQEQFAFNFAKEPMIIPDGFNELFGMGSKPTEWPAQTPTLPELIQLLQEQPKRIKEVLHNRLDETVENPLVLGGLTLHTIGEYLSFCLFHEGTHMQAIKTLKKFCS